MHTHSFNRLARLIRDPTSTTPKGEPSAPVFDGELRGYDRPAPDFATLPHLRCNNPNKVGFDLGESGASLPSGVRERERERGDRSFELRVPPATRGGGRRRRRDRERGDGVSSDASDCEPDSPISPGAVPRSPGLR